MRLEDIRVKTQIKGLLGDEKVTVVAVDWSGTDAIKLTFETDEGSVDNVLLYREDESRLTMIEARHPWTFDGDGSDYRLVAEAQRIQLAHLFDPHLAVHTSQIEPLPHQITAVYESMLPRQPLRFLLADDPGSGKTIMAGLLIRELMARGDVERCLIVCPGILVEQWQDELLERFDLRFEICTRDILSAAGNRNWFAETNLVLARLDQLARNEEIRDLIKGRGADWDLVVCDEAHKMSATYSGGEISYTKRYQLGQLLSGLTRHFLLMTATPHNGKETDFQLFMALLDGDRFEGQFREDIHASDVTDLMRRMVKEYLRKFDGRPLFPERKAYTVQYELSQDESQLYELVTEYVREEFNRADELIDNRRRTVGFALTLLQRRLASSPEAIYHSLYRRRKRLESRMSEVESGQNVDGIGPSSHFRALDAEGLDDMQETLEYEFDAGSESILDQATAARTIDELQYEIRTLRRLERHALSVRNSGTDTKWIELQTVLDEIFSGSYTSGDSPSTSVAGLSSVHSPKDKLVIFTEHVDTLNYLHDRIRTKIGRQEAVVVIHGSVGRQERLRRQEEFRNNPDVQVLLATDAAGEGVNLQRAHFMINYDLPWNPNRLEQRFGRIHRIGQTEVCHLWNLVASQTREGQVYERLLDKLEIARQALHGQVFDILGKLEFSGLPLRELLLRAIRYGEQPEVRERLHTAVDKAVDPDAIRLLLEDKRLVTDIMDIRDLEKVRVEMERAEARRLQPHFVEAFFCEAFSRFSKQLRKRENGRFELKYVPAIIRSRADSMGIGPPIPKRYERITFEKDNISVSGKARAAFVYPGHPLLGAIIDLTLEQHLELLSQGTILVDDTDLGTKPRVLVSIRHSLQDGRKNKSGSRQIVSEKLLFVELDAQGNARQIHYAPYLDYRPLGGEELSAKAILARPECGWINQQQQRIAESYAISHVVPGHLKEVKEARLATISKTKSAVKERLGREINYWDSRAVELKRDGAPRINWQDARQKADKLHARLKERMRDLHLQEQISPRPPVIVGALLVVPKGLLNQMQGNPAPDKIPSDTQESAYAARKIVMEIERKLGFEPADREFERLGYDIESCGDGQVRFIEVKGRQCDASDIQVTRNEILFSLNKPDQYILAIVLHQDDGEPIVWYRHRPFSSKPDFGVTSVTYTLKHLLDGAMNPLNAHQLGKS